MYKVYIDSIMFPIAPNSIKTEIKSQNKTINLIDGSQVNLIKTPGLSKISFKVLLPYNKYPFVDKDALSIQDYLEIIEDTKASKEPAELIILCDMADGKQKYKVSMLATLEEYSILESAELGQDTEVELEFLQYKQFGTQHTDVPKRTIPKNKYALTKYKIKKGDTLKKIAKKKMGDDEYIDQNAEAIFKKNRKILIHACHEKGKNCLHGKNLIVGTQITIPWHVTTTKEEKEAYQRRKKAEQKSKKKVATKKVVSSSTKKTSNASVKSDTITIVGTIDKNNLHTYIKGQVPTQIKGEIGTITIKGEIK